MAIQDPNTDTTKDWQLKSFRHHPRLYQFLREGEEWRRRVAAFAHYQMENGVVLWQL